MADIFQEIDEDLRRERFRDLWQRYRYVAIGLVTLAVLITAGVVEWQKWRQSQDQQLGTQFATAVALATTDEPKGLTALNDLSAGGSATGYRLLARMQAAKLQATKGDLAKAAAAYQAVAVDGAVDKPYRDLATILAAAAELGTTPDATIVTSLQPLTIAPNPWRFSAQELTALAKWHSGDHDGAVKLYQMLADDLDAPQSLRARAAAMIADNSH